MTVLEEILAYKISEVKSSSLRKPLEKPETSREDVRDFAGALAQPGMQVIAEIKQKSPSMGVIRQDLPPAEIALMYQRHGAAAISVLTDKHYFGGELEHLKAVRNTVKLPVLRKDFIVDEYQVYESYYAGADALLLIADALEADQLEYLYRLSSSLGLHVLVEAHGTAALNSMQRIKPHISGLNSRNLATMETDLSALLEKRSLLPRDSIHVAESGITSPTDLCRIAQSGFDAALIGTALAKSGDPGENLSQFVTAVRYMEQTK